MRSVRSVVLVGAVAVIASALVSCGTRPGRSSTETLLPATPHEPGAAVTEARDGRGQTGTGVIFGPLKKTFVFAMKNGGVLHWSPDGRFLAAWSVDEKKAKLM